MCCDDFDARFLSDGYPRARKPHTCEECGEQIQKGERYYRQNNLFEGRIDTFAHCMSCDAWWRAFLEWAAKQDSCWCWERGEGEQLLAEIHEELHGYDPTFVDPEEWEAA